MSLRDKYSEAILTAKNLLDERYSEPGFGGYDVPAVGRTTMFEIRNTL